MYKGASTATTEGATRQANPKKRRRRTTKRRRNPSPVTWIMIAGGTAVVAGGGIAYFVHRGRKKAREKELPIAPPTPSIPGRPSKAVKQDAPPYPFDVPSAKDVEATWAMAFVAENCDPSVGTLAKSINAISDAVFFEMYSISKIPADENRGKNWGDYINSWMRIRDLLKDRASEAGC